MLICVSTFPNAADLFYRFFFFKVKHFCVCLFNIGHAPCSSHPKRGSPSLQGRELLCARHQGTENPSCLCATCLSTSGQSQRDVIGDISSLPSISSVRSHLCHSTEILSSRFLQLPFAAGFVPVNTEQSLTAGKILLGAAPYYVYRGQSAIKQPRGFR